MKKLIQLIVVSFFTVMMALSCNRTFNKPVDDDNVIIYPAPPATTRIQFLTRISSSSDITGRRSAFARYVLGEDENRSIVKPYGLSIYRGRIYVCDTMLGGLEIIDLNTRSFEYLKPAGKGQLKKPINSFVDVDGRVYVADSERGDIVIFDESGKFVNSFGSEDILRPTDVFVTDNLIWVSDIKGHKILAFSKEDHKLIRSIPNDENTGESNLYSPTNLFVKNDQVYVSDFGDFRVKVYSTEGEFIRSIGSYGKNAGQFVRPKGISVDKQSNLYVVDAGFENVQLFNEEDQLLMFFGGSYKGPGDMWLPAKVVIDYDNLEYFRKYVHPGFELQYLIFVTNQYGPDKINVYGFVDVKE